MIEKHLKWKKYTYGQTKSFVFKKNVERSKIDEKKMKSIKCFNCNEKGHIRPNCPLRVKREINNKEEKKPFSGEIIIQNKEKSKMIKKNEFIGKQSHVAMKVNDNWCRVLLDGGSQEFTIMGIGGKAKAIGISNIEINIGKDKINGSAVILRNFDKEKVLLGTNFLDRLVICRDKEGVTIGEEKYKWIKSNDLLPVAAVTLNSKLIEEIEKQQLEEIGDEMQRKILDQYPEINALNVFDVGKCDIEVLPMQLNGKEYKRPPRYYYTSVKSKMVAKFIKILIKNEIYCFMETTYTTNFVLVPPRKEGDAYRFALDLQRKNDITAIYTYPLRCAEEIDAIPYYAKEINELQNLLTSDEYVWSDKCELSYKRICEFLTSELTIHIPNFTQDFYIFTDASEKAMAVPIKYFAKKNICVKKQKCINMLELQALTAIDNKAVIAILRESCDPQFMRYVTYISSFDYDIQYIPTKSNTFADYFTRIPVIEEYINVDSFQVRVEQKGDIFANLNENDDKTDNMEICIDSLSERQKK
uniref:CCHC-type domain-containing protein n=1 Tax=Strongyloides stercoralis TaxID=6248 RepID=A0A0K0EG23_STRER